MLDEELKKLSNLSEDIGKNLNLIQGAGGNSSVKIDKVLWVKASGYWLSDANKKNIFVIINYNIPVLKINPVLEPEEPQH